MKKKIEIRKKENDVLKTLLGIRQGVEAYLRGQFVEHKKAEKRFERYLSNR